MVTASPWPTSAAAEEVATEAADVRAYARSIAEAQAALDAGKIGAAKKALAGTEPALRNFEFDYLLARSASDGAKEGTAAPDLIESVQKPEVQVRYAVLNCVTGDIAHLCRDGSLRIVNLKDKDAEPKIIQHPQNSTTWSGEFSTDGKTLLSGHESGEVLVWDTANWELRKTISVATKPVRELTVSANGASFIAEGDKELELWTVSGDKPRKVAGVGERYNFGEGMAFHPAGDTVATGGMFDILLFDAKSGKPLNTISHASYTMGLEFSPDGKFIASAPRGNVNKFLGLFRTDGVEVFSAGPFDHYVAGMAFTPDGKRIAATGCEKLLRIFDAATGTIVLTLPRAECGSTPGITLDGLLLGWNEPDGYKFVALGSTTEK